MKKRISMVLFLLIVMPALIMTVGCSKKQVQPDVSLIGTDADQYDAARQRALAEEEAGRRALEEQRLREEQRLMEEQRKQGMSQQPQVIDEDVYFDFDQSMIRPDAQEVLRKKAEFLRENSMVSVVIEGHCDERGTAEYNLALGERRALAAKAFLMDLGISSSRLSTISYGEERPIDPRSNEEAWARNRRAHFVLQ
ncbi:MAG: peptidoglycan-associated lipoprotein Pal [Desulfobacterales bacterium]|nr:peptidoglycan-associated lipoprotein Pal [Desulfobacterales bacterium]